MSSKDVAFTLCSNGSRQPKGEKEVCHQRDCDSWIHSESSQTDTWLVSTCSRSWSEIGKTSVVQRKRYFLPLLTLQKPLFRPSINYAATSWFAPPPKKTLQHLCSNPPAPPYMGGPIGQFTWFQLTKVDSPPPPPRSTTLSLNRSRI